MVAQRVVTLNVALYDRKGPFWRDAHIDEIFEDVGIPDVLFFAYVAAHTLLFAKISVLATEAEISMIAEVEACVSEQLLDPAYESNNLLSGVCVLERKCLHARNFIDV